MVAITIALASRFIADRYGGPVMLYALLFGIAFGFLGERTKCAPGVRFASRIVLQAGVAFLGAVITFGDALALGPEVLLLIVSAVAATITCGYVIGRFFRLAPDHALLSAGAVAICGASAAMAIASVLPKNAASERNLVLTVVGVTAMSTAAMVLYPAFSQLLGMTNAAAGVFLGATIHDVAQVVGAGHMISNETGAMSALVKLVRVAMLPVVVFTIALAMPMRSNHAAKGRATLPFFLFGFMVVMGANSLAVLPAALFASLSELSKWCLVVAVAAFGMQVSLKEVVSVGARPMAAMAAQTLLLSVIIVVGVRVFL